MGPMKVVKATSGAQNGPVVEDKPEVKVSVSFDSLGADKGFQAERKASNEERADALRSTLKSLTPESALEMVKASLEKELRRCELEALEYEGEIDYSNDDEGEEDEG